MGDEGVAHIFARQVAGDGEAVREPRRQVLRRMHREIDRAGEKRAIDLLREEAFAARLRQRPVLDRVARRPDDAELETLRGAAEHRAEARLRLVRLRERQRAAPRADPDG